MSLHFAVWTVRRVLILRIQLSKLTIWTGQALHGWKCMCIIMHAEIRLIKMSMPRAHTHAHPVWIERHEVLVCCHQLSEASFYSQGERERERQNESKEWNTQIVYANNYLQRTHTHTCCVYVSSKHALHRMHTIFSENFPIAGAWCSSVYTSCLHSHILHAHRLCSGKQIYSLKIFYY